VTLDGLRGQAVAVAQPPGYEGLDPAAEHGQQPGHYRRGRQAVGVAVAVDDDVLAPGNRPEQPLHGGLHVRQELGLVDVLEVRGQEPPGLGGLGQSPVDEQLGGDGADAQLVGQPAALPGRRAGELPTGLLVGCWHVPGVSRRPVSGEARAPFAARPPAPLGLAGWAF